METILLSRATIERHATNRKMLISSLVDEGQIDENHISLNNINELANLSKVLAVPVASLFEASGDDLTNDIKVYRADEGFVRTSSREGREYYTYRHLATTDAAPELMALHVTVRCTEEDAVVLNGGHPSKELIYVLEGKIRMHWDARAERHHVDLAPGDSVFLRPGVSHSFISIGDDGRSAALLAFNYN